jgi:hypothetical protein
MDEPVVVFSTSSDVEASVVMALLDSHGIELSRVGPHQAIWPMTVSPLGRSRGGGGRRPGAASSRNHRRTSARASGC